MTCPRRLHILSFYQYHVFLIFKRVLFSFHLKKLSHALESPSFPSTINLEPKSLYPSSFSFHITTLHSSVTRYLVNDDTATPFQKIKSQVASQKNQIEKDQIHKLPLDGLRGIYK